MSGSIHFSQTEGTVLGPFFDAVQEDLSAGATAAVSVDEFYTAVTTTAASATTLADGTFIGQLKLIHLIVDGGTLTLTPSNLANGTTITYADAGDASLLLWNGSNWRVLALLNFADGATAPVLA